jgi:hypothetical protein
VKIYFDSYIKTRETDEKEKLENAFESHTLLQETYYTLWSTEITDATTSVVSVRKTMEAIESKFAKV